MLSIAFEHALDLLIGCSQSICGQLQALGVPANKVVKISNCAGFDVDQDVAKSVMAERLVREGPLRVLFLGRLDKQKGIDRLADIIAFFYSKSEIACFRVVGKSTIDGDGNFKSLVRDAEPPVYRADKLAELYEWADVVLLTSRFEGLPLTLIEAMSFGAVPIMADAGAADEVIENGMNGIIVPQHNATQDLINAIVDLASDRGRLRSLSRHAFEFSKSLNWDNNVNDFVEAVEKLRCEHRAKRSGDGRAMILG